MIGVWGVWDMVNHGFSTLASSAEATTYAIWNIPLCHGVSGWVTIPGQKDPLARLGEDVGYLKVA